MTLEVSEPVNDRALPEPLLTTWREQGFHTDELLGYILEHRALRAPDATAVITPEGSWTFAELHERSSAIARTLVSEGVMAGDVVAWMLPTDAESIAVASAIWRIGAISCPIVPIYGVREVAAVLRIATPVALISDAEIRGKNNIEKLEAAFEMSGVRPDTLLLCRGSGDGWAGARKAGAGPLPGDVVPGSADDAALILFTSGTEAEPKGALHSVQGLNHELRSTIAEWAITFRDRMFMASPITHITGLLQGFLIPARVGASSVLMERWDAAEAVRLIERERATYMAGATPFLRELLDEYDRQGLTSSSLTQYCCGGAAVPPDLIRRADELGVFAYRAWGMTEVPTATLPNEADPLWARADTDGPLAPGVELRVVDGNGSDVPTGEVGTLLLRAPEAMIGYLQPEATKQAVGEEGWFNTGDIGWMGADGYLRVEGRTKDIINRGGEKFSAREIESILMQHPSVEQVAVTAVPGGRLGERIGAAIVTSDDALNTERLGGFVRSLGVAVQKCPEIVVIVDELPLNATGKVNRARLLHLLDATGSAT